MKPRWEMLTGWKVNLNTDEKIFEYFNKESLIPGQIYRIHRLNAAPIIVEFKQFGYGYNYSMTKTYPRMLICDGAADVQIEDVTHIFAYNGDDDEDVSSTSTEFTKTADISGFKDFVVSEHLYTVNERLKGVETVSGLFTDRMQINGELKITRFDRIGEDHVHGMYVKLPTGDEIFIPASDNPLFEPNKYNRPSFKDNYTVFIEDKSTLSWNKELVDGEFYILFKNDTDSQLIQISKINVDTIDYNIITPRMNRNSNMYYPELTHRIVNMAEARNFTFIPLTDIK